MNMKVLVCAILAIGHLGSMVAAAQEVTPSSERGRQIFMRVGCYQCHGTDAQGIHAGRAWATEAMTRFIRIVPGGRMPAYPREVLSDNEIADIVAFLKTVPPPQSADSIDVLRNLKPTNQTDTVDPDSVGAPGR